MITALLVTLCLVGVTTGFAQSAESCLSAAASVRNSPRDKRVLEEARALGFSAIRSGRFEDALIVFSAIVETNPVDQMALYFQALSLFNLKRIEESEAAARLAIGAAENMLKAGPDDRQLKNVVADSLTLHAVILAVLKKNQEALIELMEAVRLSPDNFDAQFSLGRAYFGQGDTAAATEAFKKASSLRPQDVRAKFFLATALERGGNIDGATVAYRNLVSLAPSSAEGHLGLGALLVKRPETLIEGVAELQRAIDLNGDSYEGRVSLGRALILAGKPGDAIVHLKMAATLVPANPEPHYQMAMAFKKLGRNPEAAEELRTVQRLNEEHRKRSKTAASTVDKP